jgi:hypothetical protein
MDRTATDVPQDGQPLGLGLSEGLGVITRDEWVRRYAQRVRKRAGPEGAEDAADAGAEAYELQERERGNPVVWWGGPSGAHNTPEDDADEEMSYWTNDGED